MDGAHASLGASPRDTEAVPSRWSKRAFGASPAHFVLRLRFVPHSLRSALRRWVMSPFLWISGPFSQDRLRSFCKKTSAQLRTKHLQAASVLGTGPKEWTSKCCSMRHGGEVRPKCFLRGAGARAAKKNFSGNEKFLFVRQWKQDWENFLGPIFFFQTWAFCASQSVCISTTCANVLSQAADWVCTSKNEKRTLLPGSWRSHSCPSWATASRSGAADSKASRCKTVSRKPWGVWGLRPAGLDLASRTLPWAWPCLQVGLVKFPGGDSFTVVLKTSKKHL